jgi:hypothetical protein
VVARIGQRVLALRPPGAYVSATVSDGSWSIVARSSRYTVEIEGEQTDSEAVILPVPVPGRRDWSPRSRQVLAGRMTVHIRHGPRTLLRGESDLAGLEQPRCV